MYQGNVDNLVQCKLIQVTYCDTSIPCMSIPLYHNENPHSDPESSRLKVVTDWACGDILDAPGEF